MTPEQTQDFIQWRSDLKTITLSETLYYDVPRYYKRLKEEQLVDYYINHILNKK